MRNGLLPKCEKVIVPRADQAPILGDPAYPLLPLLMKEYANGGKTRDKQFFGFRLSSARMVIESVFEILKARFGCLRRNIDIKLDELPAVIHSLTCKSTS